MKIFNSYIFCYFFYLTINNSNGFMLNLNNNKMIHNKMIHNKMIHNKMNHNKMIHNHNKKNVNIINVPFDRGANVIGSRYAFDHLKEPLTNILNINKIKTISTKYTHLSTIFNLAYISVYTSLLNNKFPFTLGGDHSVAISSVAAVNTYCFNKNKTLGILWFDAHADFNTMISSPSGNIHGVPVALLCGHTLPLLQMGKTLNTNQFAYYGLRDIDSAEFIRFQDYSMLHLLNTEEIESWVSNFDALHISFDIDCLDPSIIKSVNTPVNNGLLLNNVKEAFTIIKNSNKLISMDLVEYNPLKDVNKEDLNIIINLMKYLYD